jgi:hypothetical protein
MTITTSDVRAWPSLTRAAAFLGVDKSTLSRRDDLAGQPVGQQEIRVAPGVVVRLAREYRRRILEEVVFDLVEYARKHEPNQVAAVDQEIEESLARNPLAVHDPAEALITLARDHLPADLYRQVEAALATGSSVSRGVSGDNPGVSPRSGRPVRAARKDGPSHAVPA